MDLFYYSYLVENITKDRKKTTLQGNSGTLSVTRKETVTGYKKYFCFSKDSITNTIDLKKLINKYQVTYDSINQIFVVHREDQEKPNMEFKIHESVLHCYNPTDKAVVLINNVSGNKQEFSKRQINGAEQEKTLYAKLGYPSVKDFRCIFQIQQIIYCPVTVQDIDIAHAIWINKIAYLKVNTTRNKPIHMSGGIIKTPKELFKLDK